MKAVKVQTEPRRRRRSEDVLQVLTLQEEQDNQLKSRCAKLVKTQSCNCLSHTLTLQVVCSCTERVEKFPSYPVNNTQVLSLILLCCDFLKTINHPVKTAATLLETLSVGGIKNQSQSFNVAPSVWAAAKKSFISFEITEMLWQQMWLKAFCHLIQIIIDSCDTLTECVTAACLKVDQHRKWKNFTVSPTDQSPCPTTPLSPRAMTLQVL